MTASPEIIVVGAGATGLMVASELSGAGRKVLVLEARSQIGGRVLSKVGVRNSSPVQLGAEFVHGDLPITLRLLQDAGVPFFEVKGMVYQSKNGQLMPDSAFIQNWDELLSALGATREDLPVNVFLDRHFPGERYRKLRGSVTKFVQGYDAADPAVASILALKDEWTHDEKDYFIDGGYGSLLTHLLEMSRKDGARFLLSTTVKTIRWRRGFAELTTADGQTFSAGKVLVTVPLGIVKNNRTLQGSIQFIPEIPEKVEAARKIGFGSVIKFVLEFQKDFWSTKAPGLSFMISDQIVPTWWPQRKEPVLTGWLAGPAVEQFANASEADLLRLAIQSLSEIFSQPASTLEQELLQYHIYDWTHDEFSGGAYSYTLAGNPNARYELKQPVEETLYFAGEATYPGAFGGTVEAAFAAGKEVAGTILQEKKNPLKHC